MFVKLPSFLHVLRTLVESRRRVEEEEEEEKIRMLLRGCKEGLEM